MTIALHMLAGVVGAFLGVCFERWRYDWRRRRNDKRIRKLYPVTELRILEGEHWPPPPDLPSSEARVDLSGYDKEFSKAMPWLTDPPDEET